MTCTQCTFSEKEHEAGRSAPPEDNDLVRPSCGFLDSTVAAVPQFPHLQNGNRIAATSGLIRALQEGVHRDI